MNERHPIMVGYNHIAKWIDSCYSTEQLSNVHNAIDSFARTHASNAAMPLLRQDLEQLWSTRHNSTAKMELAALKTQYHES